MSRDNLVHLRSPALMRLWKLYENAGFDLRIVGGSVRDLLQGLEPKDIDLSSNATPEESKVLLEADGIRVIETGIDHGTITAVVDHEPFEITTLRVDSDHTGRHATVSFTRDWVEDARRRDLTFNAMSLGFDGTLYDYFGGFEDLKNGVARFVGSPDQRIREDYLRILRYFRFQGRVATPKFDDETIGAIRDNVTGLEMISGERIWLEMQKILSGNHLVAILSAMNATGVDHHIWLKMPFLDEAARVRRQTKDPALVLTALLPDERAIERVTQRWKLPRAVQEVSRFIVANRDQKLAESAAKAHYVDPRKQNDLLDALLTYQGRHELLDRLRTWQVPVFPVTGKDLLELGYESGPEMGQTLRELQQQWQRSNYLATRGDLLSLLDK